jgi:hypothetical protein
MRRNGGDFPAFWEAVIGLLLIASALFLYATNWEQVREIDLFALVLVVQSLPFLASVGLAAIEGTRVNDLMLWRGLEAKLFGLWARRDAVAKAPVAEKQVETAQ